MEYGLATVIVILEGTHERTMHCERVIAERGMAFDKDIIKQAAEKCLLTAGGEFLRKIVREGATDVVF